MRVQRIKDKEMILILLNQEVSAFNASFSIARDLSELGYRVVYAVIPIFETYIAKNNFEYKVIKPLSTDKQERKELSPFQEVEAIEELFTIDIPKLVFIDQLIWWKSTPFIKRNIPVVGLNTCLASAWSLMAPPVFSGIIPNAKVDLLLRIQCLIAWLKIFLGYCSPCDNVDVFKIIAANYFGRSWLGTLHVTFKKLVNKHGGSVRWGEYGYRLDVPELVMCPREFDFPWLYQRTSRCYIGACIDPHRNDSQSPWTKDGEKYSIDWNEINEEKSLIYCSLGTHSHIFKDRKKLINATIKAVQKRPHLQLIIQIRNEADTDKCKPLPDNVKVVTWVPQIEILSRASIFITHGGLGSVREAIYFGVPMIVFPFWNDGFGNAARVVFHHLGLRGDIKKATPELIGNFIDRISADDSIHYSVKQMQRLFREQKKCKRAIDFLKQLGAL